MRIELPIVSFISTLLVLMPLPWHWKMRNVCTISFIFWLAGCNILRTINTIVWLDNVTVKYETWCDVVTRFIAGANIGVPASTVCICRRLAQASAPYYKSPNRTERRQRVRFEIGMCIALPAVLAALHIIVEPCRFSIGEEFGCGPCYYPSIPGLFISYAPAVLLAFAASVYSGVTLRWLIHRRVQFHQTSGYKQPIAASGRYLRLVVLAISQMTFASVMSLFLMSTSIEVGIRPWASRKDVHKNWRGDILVQPKDSATEFYRTTVLFAWYFLPITSVMTFGYFGFDDRVAAEYKSMLVWIKPHTPCIKLKKDDVLPLRVHNAIVAQN